ncbi:MAG: YhbY family RNA-binding protein [Betaproteobacteria bacterium]|nr:YhbY family RNA-binding protein [Betaproteobacteria bacterium]
MKQRTSAERSELRARAHPLSPIVIIGNGGLTAGVLAEIERSLNAHELIKIRVGGADHAGRESMYETICANSGASPVQHIGRILVIYRERPKEEPTVAPRKPRAKAAKPERRSMKQSFGRPTTTRSKSDLARPPRGARR